MIFAAVMALKAYSILPQLVSRVHRGFVECEAETRWRDHVEKALDRVE
jgi:hypothetical protein